MAIGGQRVDKATSPHEDETHGVAQTVGLVQPGEKQRERLLVQWLVNPDNLDVGVVKQIDDEVESVIARNASNLSQGYKFRKNVVMRQPQMGRVQ